MVYGLCGLRRSSVCRFWVITVLALASCMPGVAVGDAFDEYQLVASFELPIGAAVFDVLTDGRIVTIVDADIHVENAAGTGAFSVFDALPDADIAGFGAAFLRVSPNGMRLAVGNNGGASGSSYQVGVFDLLTLTGTWFSADSFDGEWVDDDLIALAAGDFATGVITVLDTTSPDPLNPTNSVVIENIGGASGGITFDPAGNLYTGNGFMNAGPSGTGAVKMFDQASWSAVLSGGTPIDFEESGILIVDILSAASLGFDGEGNLHVTGGDFDLPKVDFVALVRAAAVQNAIQGLGSADIKDPAQVRRLDPDADDDFNFYSANYNPVLGRIYVRSFGANTTYVYATVASIPTVSQWGLIVMTLLLITSGSVLMRQRCQLAEVAHRAK